MQGFAFLAVEFHEFNVQSLPSALLKLSLDEILPMFKNPAIFNTGGGQVVQAIIYIFGDFYQPSTFQASRNILQEAFMTLLMTKWS